MAQRARTNKNTSLATSNGSGYNKKKGGSYSGSTTGLSTEKSPLNTQKTDFTAPKKTTITPKETEENYFQKARDTQRELTKPLPRINDAPKKDESNFSLSAESAQKKENPFTGYFSKKLNLPSREERNFAMGAIGEESERAAYNDGVVEEFEKAGYLTDSRTQDDFFRDGFYEKDTPPKYEFTAKADDKVKKELFNLLDFGKDKIELSKSPHMQEFAKKQAEINKFRDGAARVADPNVRIISTPKQDAQAIREEYNAKTAEMYRNMADTADVIKSSGELYDTYMKANNSVGESVKQVNNTQRVAKLLSEGYDLSTALKFVSRTGKPTISKAIGWSGHFIDAALTFQEELDKGKDTGKAALTTGVKTISKAALSWAYTKGGASLGARIGGYFGTYGLVIGSVIGFAGGMLLDVFTTDKLVEGANTILHDVPENYEDSLIFQ